MGKQKQRERQENSQTMQKEGFTCEICIEPIAPNKKFTIKKCCDHPFCQDCIAKYIEVKIEDKVADINCPGSNCRQSLDPFSCRPIIPLSLFTKWCDNLCDSYVLGFERSYCPNRSCMALVVNECGGTVKKTKCPNCKQFFCFQCKLTWHAGYRCEEAEHMRDRNDILFGRLVEANSWPRCPGCGHCIELRAGCNVIKCRCNTYFCYRCGEKLSGCMCGRPWDPTTIFCLLLLIWVFILVCLGLVKDIKTYNNN